MWSRKWLGIRDGKICWQRQWGLQFACLLRVSTWVLYSHLGASSVNKNCTHQALRKWGPLPLANAVFLHIIFQACFRSTGALSLFRVPPLPSYRYSKKYGHNSNIEGWQRKGVKLSLAWVFCVFFFHVYTCFIRHFPSQKSDSVRIMNCIYTKVSPPAALFVFETGNKPICKLCTVCSHTNRPRPHRFVCRRREVKNK